MKFKSNRDYAIAELNRAFHKNELTLYVGAGASVDSYVPTWHQLIQNIFLNSLELPDYDDPAILRATAERWFESNIVPLDIAARELKTYFKDEMEFLQKVRFALYNLFSFDSNHQLSSSYRFMIEDNKTLQAIAKLCCKTKTGHKGLRCVINYNFDGLLEKAIGSYIYQPIWRNTAVKKGKLPIYHVHGFLPLIDWQIYPSGRTGSLPKEILLTEDQYHREAANAGSWRTRVQLRAMSNSKGLMIGLSLTDPNMRRLLDIARNAPERPVIYALLKKNKVPELTAGDMEQMFDRIQFLRKMMTKFYHIHYKTHPKFNKKLTTQDKKVIVERWNKLAHMSQLRQVSVLRELGIEPIWCEFSEIPGILDKIGNGM